MCFPLLIAAVSLEPLPNLFQLFLFFFFLFTATGDPLHPILLISSEHTLRSVVSGEDAEVFSQCNALMAFIY